MVRGTTPWCTSSASASDVAEAVSLLQGGMRARSLLARIAQRCRLQFAVENRCGLKQAILNSCKTHRLRTVRGGAYRGRVRDRGRIGFNFNWNPDEQATAPLRLFSNKVRPPAAIRASDDRSIDGASVPGAAGCDRTWSTRNRRSHLVSFARLSFGRTAASDPAQCR
jgi:hypothetical protein